MMTTIIRAIHGSHGPEFDLQRCTYTDRRFGNIVLLGLCVLSLAGCADETTASGGDETGDALPAEPLDPFEGEGGDPPGDPDPSAEWAPPSTLGNGLVYDTRFDIAEQSNSYSRDASGLDLSAGVDWRSFVTPHATKLGRGFRPTAVDADVSLTSSPDGELTLELVDRSTYMADDESNYRHETRTYIFAGPLAEQALAQSGAAQPGVPRPISIDTFTLPAGGSLGDTVVWVYDNNPVPWKIVVGQGAAVFPTTVDNLADAGYRPISVASRTRDQDSEYSAIFVADGVPIADGPLDIGLNWGTIGAAAEAGWAAGYYPVRGTFEQGSAALPLFNLLWARRSPELTLELRYNLDQALFESEDVNWRSQGYALENATMYLDAGEERFTGVWVRHEPYFREVIDDDFLDESDATFLARYGIFEDRVIQSMTLEGEQKQGEYFRSSATLHIWDGNDLVINRAYTYAPALYPDTPINATMSVASVSKSITAAAVVKVLAENGNIPLTQAFAATAGLANDWPMAASPSIAAVLGNVGGFASGGFARNYKDHANIAASGWGTLPIDEEELADYVVGEGLLDGGKADDYWKSAKVGTFIYSNPGFSVLGELVRVQSGVSYEDYVSTNLLDPMNLDDDIFADRGNRNTVDESLVSKSVPLGRFQPLKSHLRKYLINTSHPYVCMDDPPCIPEVPPVDSSPSPAKWRTNVAPADTSTPDTAAEERYSGSLFLGGAPLAAGGWQADGKSLGNLMRGIAQSEFLMPASVASQLWAPQWLQFEKNVDKIPAPDWAYGLGWYVRGNWVAWAGGTVGASALVLHNLRYDFTVVILTNITGNGIADLAPLFTPICVGDVPNCWDTSTLGALFPCWNDPNTVADECPVAVIH